MSVFNVSRPPTGRWCTTGCSSCSRNAGSTAAPEAAVRETAGAHQPWFILPPASWAKITVTQTHLQTSCTHLFIQLLRLSLIVPINESVFRGYKRHKHNLSPERLRGSGRLWWNQNQHREKEFMSSLLILVFLFQDSNKLNSQYKVKI